MLSIVVLQSAVAPAPLLAEPPGDAMAIARKHYDAAIAHEKEKDWDGAILEYEAARSLFPDPEFDFLIGDVELERGNKMAAFLRYESYLAADPDGRASAWAREMLDKLRTELIAEMRARARQRTFTLGTTARRPVMRSRAARRAPVPSKLERVLRVGTVGLGATGALAFIIGVEFGLKARKAESALRRQWDPALYEEGQTAERNMKIMWSAAGAAVLGAAVLYVVAPHTADSSAPERLSVAPAAAPDFAGLLVRGGF